jgi:MULE transposase domain
MLRQNNLIVKEPNDPQFQSVPTQLITTHRQDPFLRCDTGPGNWKIPLNINYYSALFLLFSGDDRILIFASQEQLHILQTAADFLVDGTFKVVPEIFYQLFIIHAVHRQHIVPVLYALLRRKNADTYCRLIDEVIKIAPNWSPTTIMMDFEQASISAFRQKFQNATLSGCYFHL